MIRALHHSHAREAAAWLALLLAVLAVNVLTAPAARADTACAAAAAEYSTGSHVYLDATAYKMPGNRSQLDQQIADTHRAIYVAFLPGTERPADLHAAYPHPGVFVTVDRAGFYAHGYDVPAPVAAAAVTLADQGMGLYRAHKVTLDGLMAGYVSHLAAVAAPQQASTGGGADHPAYAPPAPASSSHFPVLGVVILLAVGLALLLLIAAAVRALLRERAREDEQARAREDEQNLRVARPHASAPQARTWTEPADPTGEYTVPQHSPASTAPAQAPIRHGYTDSTGQDRVVVVNNTATTSHPDYWPGGRGFPAGYYPSPIDTLLEVSAINAMTGGSLLGGGREDYRDGYEDARRDERDQGPADPPPTADSSTDGGGGWAPDDTPDPGGWDTGSTSDSSSSDGGGRWDTGSSDSSSDGGGTW